MTRSGLFKAVLAGSVCSAALISAASARNFTIPGGDLESALTAYSTQSGIGLIVSDDEVKGVRSKGVSGDMSDDAALARILSGTGFVVHHHPSGKVGIARGEQSVNTIQDDFTMQLAQATPAKAAVETVTVTSSKLGGADVQSVPIAITALSQEQLTASQTNGGPDLIKQVPNMSFTKTNFSGYSIQIRGIGTQAISVTTDPAVAVAMNDIPFIRNHFFEQEFYDVGQIEVLRGPQGTLYGRNATAGVVNLTSAKPTDQFEAMASGEIGNYQQRRFEGMVNLPIVDDRLDIRLAGEWTKHQGYSFNDSTDNRIDGRDLWSGRMTIGLKPTENLQMYLVWEHFSENDDRLRSSKQLCKTDNGPGSVDGIPKLATHYANLTVSYGGGGEYFTQGCAPASLYSPESFEVPLDFSLPFVAAVNALAKGTGQRPYPSETQSSNLRGIDSVIDPIYKAKNDVVELNADYQITPSLTFTSQTGFGHDFLYSAEDFNRFGSVPGVFKPSNTYPTTSNQYASNQVLPDGTFCDPQLGCSNRLIVEDLSQEHAWQLSQEFRFASNFSGPFNFSAGGNYMHYETEENYYVFSNAFTLSSAAPDPNHPWVAGVSDNSSTLTSGFQYNDPLAIPTVPSGYIDPNPLSKINGNGHNYFRSTNPYVLNSYAAFGETYFNILSDLKLVAGLRWTEDQKHFPMIPSWLLESGWGYPVAGVVDQQWDQFTGRAVANWAPKLAFTNQTLIYGSYSHGYKAGGANPPGAISPAGGFGFSGLVQATHPLTFKPEFIDAFELGTKNTLLDGTLTLNGNLFYYNYENYQVSQIVDRTAINQNFDAHVKGAELEATWEPVPGLRFNFSGGWEDTAIAKGESAIDLMDRTAGTPGWYVIRPFINQSSNCIFPTAVAKYIFGEGLGYSQTGYCADAYFLNLDPLTEKPYTPTPTLTGILGTLVPAGAYPGFNPATAPNDGEGFAKDIGGNSLPNAPPWTLSFGAQYSVPLSSDWAGTLRTDLYWQDASWWRVFNDNAYDKLHAYSTVNLTLILTNQAGWQVMLYDKNVFNTTAITGAFLNSDDTGLTTNVFLTDPKLVGIRVTKNW